VTIFLVSTPIKLMFKFVNSWIGIDLTGKVKVGIWDGNLENMWIILVELLMKV
jgi:hypothetical protein